MKDVVLIGGVIGKVKEWKGATHPEPSGAQKSGYITLFSALLIFLSALVCLQNIADLLAFGFSTETERCKKIRTTTMIYSQPQLWEVVVHGQLLQTVIYQHALPQIITSLHSLLNLQMRAGIQLCAVVLDHELNTSYLDNYQPILCHSDKANIVEDLGI